MMSEELLMFLRAFVPEYHHAKFGGNWTANKGEMQNSPARIGLRLAKDVFASSAAKLIAPICHYYSLFLDRFGKKTWNNRRKEYSKLRPERTTQKNSIHVYEDNESDVSMLHRQIH